MAIYIGLALGLILVGLVMVALHGGIKGPLLQRVVYLVGIALIVIGLILLAAPVIVWAAGHLRAMLGQP